MASTRVRVLSFLGAISAFTALVQWDAAPRLLDALTGGIQWSAGFVQFFKENTQGLIELILLGVYFEFLGLSKSRDRERGESDAAQDLLGRALRSTNSSALVHGGLSDQFGADAADHIQRNFLKECVVFRNLTLKISVKPHADGYSIVVAIAYDKDSPDFLVGVTDNPLQCEALIATGLLSEVFVISPIGNSIPAKVRKRVKDRLSGSHVYHSLDFEEMSQRSKRKLFAKTTLQSSVDKFRIFEGSSPSLRSDYDGPVMFEVLHESTQSAEYPYTFWISDRVLQVKSIEVDMRSLSPEQQAGARIHLFMSSLQWSEDINPDNGVWHFPLQTWLLPGQGLMVMWSGNPERECLK